MKKEYATFRIAFKILLRKGNKILFLRMANKKLPSFLDLPGGRADKGEEMLPFKQILKREVKEEIGKKVKYKIKDLAFQHIRYFNPEKIYALVLVNIYEGEYLSGKIELSSDHNSYEWIDPKRYEFKKKDFMCKEEYLAFKEYLKF